MLVLIKPDFLYDRNLNKYKEFGTDENQTILTLPIVSIVIAILMSLIGNALKSTDLIINKNNTNTNEINYKFIPVPVYYNQQQPPMMQIPFNQSISANNQFGGMTITPEMLMNNIK